MWIPLHSRRAGCEFLWWSRPESSNRRWLVQFPMETLDPEALCFFLWLRASVAELSIWVFNGSGATWWTWVPCPPHHWGSIPEARGWTGISVHLVESLASTSEDIWREELRGQDGTHTPRISSSPQTWPLLTGGYTPASAPLRLSVSMAKAMPRGPGLWSLDDARGRGSMLGEWAKSRRSLTPRAACSSVVLHPHEYRPSFLSPTCHARVQCPWTPSLWWSSEFCLQHWS